MSYKRIPIKKGYSDIGEAKRMQQRAFMEELREKGGGGSPGVGGFFWQSGFSVISHTLDIKVHA